MPWLQTLIQILFLLLPFFLCAQTLLLQSSDAPGSITKINSRINDTPRHRGHIFDHVQFRAAAPMVIRPGHYFKVKIMMHLDRDQKRARRESTAAAATPLVATSSTHKAARGDRFPIVLQSPDFPLFEEAVLCWNGRYAASEFLVRLPETYTAPQLRLLARVYSGGLQLTDLNLILEISPASKKILAAVRRQNVSCAFTHFRSVFVSYASADRSEVVKYLSAMQFAKHNLDIFLDVEALRVGEEFEPRLYTEILQRDLFCLFWSPSAARSPWVRRELSFALAHKPENTVQCIPLQDPDDFPLPEELRHRHFRYPLMKYMKTQKSG